LFVSPISAKNLNQVLFDEPFRFEFFQAVRLFEKIFPERKPVGKDALPNEEVVRFRSRVALDFPASEIHELRETIDPLTEETRMEMLVNFMGMVGVSGVLPTHYSELALDRIRHRDTSMWAFLDIFTIGLCRCSFELGKNTDSRSPMNEAMTNSRVTCST
jgi:type VI secretion system protein ImpH